MPVKQHGGNLEMETPQGCEAKGAPGPWIRWGGRRAFGRPGLRPRAASAALIELAGGSRRPRRDQAWR